MTLVWTNGSGLKINATNLNRLVDKQGDTMTGSLTSIKDLENIKLVPASADGRMQIQWADAGTDVVSLDVHGDPHNHIELYTYSPTAATLVKRWAVDYNVDNPAFETTGAGLVMEGQSTVENAAGGDPKIRFQGTKTTSRIFEIKANASSMEWVDVTGGTVNRMNLDLSNGNLTIQGNIDHNGSNIGFYGVSPITRRTGWSAATGTATRTTFATGSVTLPVLAEHVKALIDDLLAYGLLGA